MNGMMLMGFRIFGGLIVRFFCLRQVDLKMLIAYSSVSHISMVIGGLVSNYLWGITGILAIIVAHGFCSSGLFCLSNILYERVFSRRMIYLGGIGYIGGGMIIFLFFLCIINMGVPLSMGFFREIFLLTRLVKFRMVNILILILLILFVSGYSLYLFSHLYHGRIFYLMSLSMFEVREYILILIHIFPLVIFIVKGDILVL